MSDVSGTLRNVIIDGISYDVMADTNVSEVGSLFENESIATSGRNMRRMTKRPQNAESVVIAANGAEKERLKNVADSIEDVRMSYETASGDVYRADGWIEFENRQTEENRATIVMCPRIKWEPFLA